MRGKLEILKQHISGLFVGGNSHQFTDDIINNFDNVDSEVVILKRHIDDLKQTLNMAETDPGLFSDHEILEMQLELDKLESKLKKLQDTEENVSNKSNTNWSKGIVKILKYGATLLSIRTIYSLLSNCSNEWLNSNDESAKQLKANIEYMKYAVGSAFKGVLQWIVNTLYQILSLVNSIAKSFFGIDLFSSASVEDYIKMQKSSEKIKKNLQQTGFDEQTVLQDNSSESGSVPTAPSIDLSKTNESALNTANKIKNVATDTINFWDKEWTNYFDYFGNEWDLAWNGLLLTLEGFYMIFKGVWDSLGGVVDIFIGIFTGDTDKIKEGWDKLCKGIKEIFVGLFEIIGGILTTAVGVILGIFIGLLEGIYNSFIKPVIDFFAELVENWKNGFSIIKEWASEKFENLKKIISSAIDFIISLPSKIKDAFEKAFNNILNVAKNIWNKILNLFSKGGQIFNGITDGISSTFKNVVNSLISGINTLIATPFKKINKLLNSIRNTSFLGISPFKNLWSENPLPVPKIPKLAKGGIVNAPTQAIIGEAGREAVLPLENNREWMYELADIISQNSGSQNINLVVDGKVLAKIVNNYNKKQQFATNR